MSRESGSEHPSQRTVAELLAEYGGNSQRGSRRRRRRAEDASETAPQAIINRVLSDSGQLRAIDEDGAQRQHTPPPANNTRGAAPTQSPGPTPAPPGPQQAGPAPVGAMPPSPGPTAAPTPPPASQEPAAPPAAGQEPVSQEAERQPNPGNFWAQRFAAAGSSRTAAPEPEAPVPDAEATAQQPALPVRQPQPFPHQGPAASPAPSAPAPPAPAAPPVESATEQLPPVAAQDPVASSAEATAVTEYPASVEYSAGPETGAFDVYADLEDSQDYGRAPDYGDVDYGESTSLVESRLDYDDTPDYDDQDEYEDFEEEQDVPAGLAADYEDDQTESEGANQSSGREWAFFVVQGILGLLAGGAVWFGFRWLWSEISVAALVAALAVTGILVLVARKLLRTDDLQTILLAVLVGLVCTVSPAALLLIGH